MRQVSVYMPLITSFVNRHSSYLAAVVEFGKRRCRPLNYPSCPDWSSHERGRVGHSQNSLRSVYCCGPNVRLSRYWIRSLFSFCANPRDMQVL